jgi:hypothetical protein
LARPTGGADGLSNEGRRLGNSHALQGRFAGLRIVTAPQDPDDEADRTTTNIFLAVVFLLVVGGGVWLVNALVDQRKIQDCVAQGRRNCAPIDMPARER